MQIGDIVISLKGHDAGKPFVVVAQAGDEFVLIADGKSRGMEKPKLKRKRHLRVVAESGIKNPTNATLKKRIKQYVSDRRLYAEK
ncbi:MAG: KOW domain-containing protein [Clostridiales bacterium]|nr:KOW domain-containing protein [Clostridiales bacterium]